MALKLMYITNQIEVAKIAEKHSVDRIFIDLEKNGKAERQAYKDTVKSNHEFSDINKIRNVISKSDILVRINPLYDKSNHEINEVIERGADIVMLPMWRKLDEVKKFYDLVNGRAKISLLLETVSAQKELEKVLEFGCFDEIHIGLNDLHLDYKLKFMFELLSNGTVENIARKLNHANKTFGFGGIADLNSGLISGKNIIAEHYRLNSKLAILSRSFCNTDIVKDIDMIDKTFSKGINQIRKYEKYLENQDESFFLENKKIVQKKVGEILNF
ncbi:aldolase [Marinilabiliaceae bacterium JC040]|nr:aldolase [Marinilabiliaceae bacterium JC040]